MLLQKIIKKSLICLLLLYKRFLSPLFPNSCRFYPSCSTYAIQAIEKYGIFRGLLKSGYRLLRCNPLCKGGVDPV